MTKTFIGGDTTVTIPVGTVGALTSLGVKVSTFGSATASFDKAGDLVADFKVTGGYAGAYDEILHQGSGLTFSDTHGSITVSDFRIDTHHNIVYGDVSLTVNGQTTSLNNVDIFNIGKGLALTFTSDAIAAVNTALGSSLTTAVPVGTAAPAPVANPLPVCIEQNPLFTAIFGAGGGAGISPVVGGFTDVTLTAAATLKSLGVSVVNFGASKKVHGGASPTFEFAATGGDETSAGDVILHEGSGLTFSDKSGYVKLADFLVDTIHDVVDADVTVNGKYVGDIAVLTIGSGASLTLTSAAASALDTALGLGSALSDTTTIGTAAPHPLSISPHAASVLTKFA